MWSVLTGPYLPIVADPKPKQVTHTLPTKAPARKEPSPLLLALIARAR